MTRTRTWPSETFPHHNCADSAWNGDPARCRKCDRPLPARNGTFCTLDCKLEFLANHSWASARKRVRRDRRTCERCGSRRFLQVHHVQPCEGVRTLSCHHHQDNLLHLCDPCHKLEHRSGQVLEESRR